GSVRARDCPDQVARSPARVVVGASQKRPSGALGRTQDQKPRWNCAGIALPVKQNWAIFSWSFYLEPSKETPFAHKYPAAGTLPAGFRSDSAAGWTSQRLNPPRRQRPQRRESERSQAHGFECQQPTLWEVGISHR